MEKHLTMRVKVIDAICGAGKSSWAIQEINDNINLKGFKKGVIRNIIYITPFIKETKRINQETNEYLKIPNEKYGEGKKLNHVKKLIDSEESIVMTHELFSRLDNKVFKDIEEKGYILFMDEVTNVIEKVDLSEDDINLLFDAKVISVDENNKVKWELENYSNSEKNRFGDIKIFSETDSLYYYKSSEEKRDLLFQIFNPKAFTCFKEFVLLTYLFDGQLQKCYFDFLGVEYEKLSVKKEDDKYKLVEYDPSLDNREQIKMLLNVYEDMPSKTNRSKLNTSFLIKGETDGLTSRWFNKKISNSKANVKTKEEILNQLNKNTKIILKRKLN